MNRKPVLTTIVIILLLSITTSIFLVSNKKVSLAISAPSYPSKIGFEDYDKEEERYEEINESYIDSVKDFSIKSSSIVFKDSNRDKNDLYSPISLYMALAMVSETADGETRNQIVSALQSNDIDIIRSETGKLFRRLYYHNEIGKLTIGNSLWLNENVNFNNNLLQDMAKNYYAHSFSLDFKDDKSPEKISKWVSENTGGKLGNDKSSFTLKPDDVMVLINTIYLYDQWIDEFKTDLTEEDIFYLADGSTVNSDFMNMTHASQSFVKGQSYTASGLSLKNLSQMIFILPDEGISPYDLVSDEEQFKNMFNNISEDNRSMGEVVFKVPKFNFKSDLELNDLIKSLGIVDIFDRENANFAPLSDTKPLFISGVSQKANISIDEKGVEATAYTDIRYAGAAPPDGRAEMILNRPFIFILTGSGNIPLFVGIINNPSVN